MQTILSEPRRDKYSILLEDDSVRVGASSMQGWRSTMEDAHYIALSLPNLSKPYTPESGFLAAVFDGHRGSKVSQTCANSILGWITNSASFKSGKFKQSLTDAYLAGDAELNRNLPQEQSGATGVTVMMVGHSLMCANAGDSRAVLCRDGKAVPLSFDHKPLHPKEKKRVEKAGGFVSDNGRVNGMLSLSRAFGDFTFKRNAELSDKEQAVTVDPDVMELTVTPLDEFVIMACDGIWDCMTNEEVVDFLRDEIGNHGDAALACERLMEICVSITPNGVGTDNMTTVLVHFKSNFLRSAPLPDAQ